MRDKTFAIENATNQLRWRTKIRDGQYKQILEQAWERILYYEASRIPASDMTTEWREVPSVGWIGEDDDEPEPPQAA